MDIAEFEKILEAGDDAKTIVAAWFQVPDANTSNEAAPYHSSWLDASRELPPPMFGPIDIYSMAHWWSLGTRSGKVLWVDGYSFPEYKVGSHTVFCYGGKEYRMKQVAPQEAQPPQEVSKELHDILHRACVKTAIVLRNAGYSICALEILLSLPNSIWAVSIGEMIHDTAHACSLTKTAKGFAVKIPEKESEIETPIVEEPHGKQTNEVKNDEKE